MDLELGDEMLAQLHGGQEAIDGKELVGWLKEGMQTAFPPCHDANPRIEELMGKLAGKGGAK